jgi:uncharacterized membrane protein
MPGDLIRAYLADLQRTLPAGITEEVADGLTAACEYHQASGLGADDAALAAVAEFGNARKLAEDFTRHAPGRRAARLLMASGPPVGGCWATALVVAGAWTWPVPGPARVAFGAAMLLAVAVLIVAATSQHSYRRTMLAIPGGAALITLDMIMITVTLTTAPTVTWTLAIAITASLSRIGLATRLVPRILAR